MRCLPISNPKRLDIVKAPWICQCFCSFVLLSVPVVICSPLQEAGGDVRGAPLLLAVNLPSCPLSLQRTPRSSPTSPLSSWQIKTVAALQQPSKCPYSSPSPNVNCPCTKAQPRRSAPHPPSFSLCCSTIQFRQLSRAMNVRRRNVVFVSYSSVQ
jgi:hypothetical protein